MSSIEVFKSEINLELQDKNTVQLLLQNTFKGLSEASMKKAILEGMLRGFNFKDFLERNVYAIPFKENYSLVTSIDYARKIGMRSGVVGKSAPKFEEKGQQIVSCSITVQKKVGEHIGDYTATVFFDEYNTKRNLWLTKPRTMISKVAEMHALRMACPEELSQNYIEDELEQENVKPEINIKEHELKLIATKNIEELKEVWSALPVEAKNELESVKNKIKSNYENPQV